MIKKKHEGTKIKMPREKKYSKPGNPNFGKADDPHTFKAKGKKTVNGLLAVRIDEELLAELKILPDWKEQVRASAADIVEQAKLKGLISSKTIS